MCGESKTMLLLKQNPIPARIIFCVVSMDVFMDNLRYTFMAVANGVPPCPEVHIYIWRMPKWWEYNPGLAYSN